MRFNKWQQVRDRYGNKEMPDILADLYAKHGSHKRVAQELGVTEKGLRDWRRALKCKVETTVRIVACKE